MELEPLPRKLAAILYADVAGYSRLTGEDEDTTHRRLAEYLDQIAVTIARHGGRVMHYAGDAVLAMFEAVVDAVSCAAHIQNDLETRNEDLPDERKVQFRIGVNMGDVIEDREDIYGDGVNVAARLESLAEPGGICISESVHTAVGSKLPFDYEFLGEQEVKNIAKPVRAYSAQLKPGATLPGPSARPKTPRPVHYVMAAAAAAVVLVIGAGVIAWWQPWQTREEPASIERMAFPLPQQPSIAVLPFDNMTADPNQEYFVDGVTENIITTLSRLPRLFVIARKSTFAYKGKSVKVQQVAEDLGVQYVLEGSVQKFGDRVRVNAQLIDALEGHHIWAERYDREMKDIFAVQDEISLNVASSLRVVLTEGEQARLVRNPTDSLAAWDYYRQADVHYQRWTREENAKARELLRKAVQLDPEYADAWVFLSWTHWIDVRFGWSESREKSFERAVELAEHALTIDDDNPRVYGLLGSVHLVKGEHDKAIALGEKAVALNPNFAQNRALLAITLFFSGRPEDALVQMERAMRLNPSYSAWYLMPLQEAYRLTGRYDEAIATVKEELERVPMFFTRIRLALYYSLLGRQEEARSEIKEVLKMNPEANLEDWAKAQFFKDPAQLERDLAALREAGLPEK